MMEPSRKGLMSRTALALPTAALLAALMLAACSQTLNAPATLESQAVFTVTSEGNSGDGTLREAITNATAGDTITFAPSVRTVTLVSELFIDKDLTIAGPEGGGVTVSGNNSTRVFSTRAGTTKLRNLTITGGNADEGGGIYIYNGGTLSLTNSTISGNNGGFGGGINNRGTLTVTNSTISGNSADVYGGGISNQGTFTVTNSTVSGNGASLGGGIENRGSLNLRNSIIALNSNRNGMPSPNIYGSISSDSNNIVGGNPGLELDNDGKPKLADNSGPTKTIALLADSPALNKANSASCPATDQRGVERPQGSGCDIGAFELEVESDTTAPTITLTTPADGATYLLNQSVTASYSCADEEGGSGVKNCEGTVPSGSAIDTSSVGTKTFAVSATDNAGNPSTKTVKYTVGYAFSGFSSPVDNLPTLNSAKAGQSIPLKWRLTDASGAPVTTLSNVQVGVSSLSCSTGSGADAVEEYASGSSGLQNLGDGYYQYNWKTPKNYAGSCKTLKLNLGDGTSHTAQFSFK